MNRKTFVYAVATILALSSLIAIAPTCSADDVQEAFGEGQAELSSYKTIQPRYGELREATTVMIVVPQDVSRATRIKVEDYANSPPDEWVPVIKFNRVLRFATGIYDYAVMTTVFSSLETPTSTRPERPLKISLASRKNK